MNLIQRTNLPMAVAQKLLASISKGNLKPGDKLPSEAQLCRRFGVSRTSIREGIKALAGINILTVYQGRGTFVNEDPQIMAHGDALKMVLSSESLKKVYEVRFALDMGLAGLVASKADDDDVRALRAGIGKMEKALRSHPINSLLASEADEDFHLAFCRAAHNKIIEKIYRPIITHVMVRTWKQIKGSREFGRMAVKGHREILNGIEKREAKSILEAVEKHLKTVFKGMEKE